MNDGFFFFSECSSGGRCLSVEYTDKVGEVAKKHGLKLHIDGARIFNASIVSKFSTLLTLKMRCYLSGKSLPLYPQGVEFKSPQ